MSIAIMRADARAAVDATIFKSSLPTGVSDDATVRHFLDSRRQEIVAAARGALNDHARVLQPEMILRLLYGVVSEEEFSIFSAP